MYKQYIPITTWTQCKEKWYVFFTKPLTIRINIYQLNELGGKPPYPGEQ